MRATLAVHGGSLSDCMIEEHAKGRWTCIYRMKSLMVKLRVKWRRRKIGSVCLSDSSYVVAWDTRDPEMRWYRGWEHTFISSRYVDKQLADQVQIVAVKQGQALN